MREKIADLKRLLKDGVIQCEDDALALIETLFHETPVNGDVLSGWRPLGKVISGVIQPDHASRMPLPPKMSSSGIDLATSSGRAT